MDRRTGRQRANLHLKSLIVTLNKYTFKGEFKESSAGLKLQLGIMDLSDNFVFE